MARFFVPKEAVKGNNIVVTGEEAHHILDVMRLKVQDKVVTFDGTGKEYVGFIKEAKRKSLLIEILETRKPVNSKTSRITLIQAIPTKEKRDYIVEKATELGVYSIAPVMTDRTIVKWDGAKKKKAVERWRKIAKESSKQCGRTDVAIINSVEDFSEIVNKAGEYDLSLIAALNDEAVKLKDALKEFTGGKVAVAIGPEGDFTPDEVKKAKNANFKLVNLGSLVLRSDTAGLATLAILNYEFSN